VRFGAAISLPSNAYVHAWYGHWNARLTLPASSTQMRAPRCRQTLRNALRLPWRSRAMSTLSRPTCTVRKSPGFARSLDLTAQNHISSKMFSCSRAKIAGSV
jgi:hypothetical protein